MTIHFHQALCASLLLATISPLCAASVAKQREGVPSPGATRNSKSSAAPPPSGKEKALDPGLRRDDGMSAKRPVAVLVLLARAARARIVAADLGA